MANKGHRFFGPLWDLVARLNSGGEFSRRRRLNVRDGTNTLAALVDAPSQNELQLSYSVSSLSAAGVSHAGGVAPDPGASSHTQQWFLRDTALWAPALGQVLASLQVATDQSTTSLTAVDLTTPESITFTLDRTSDVLALYFSETYNASSGFGDYAALFVDTVNVEAIPVIIPSANAPMPGFLYYIAAALAAGSHTFKVQHYVGGGTGHWLHRILLALLLS